MNNAFITGAACSGTSILGELIATHPDVNYIFKARTVGELGGDGVFGSHRLDQPHTTPQVITKIKAWFATHSSPTKEDVRGASAHILQSPKNFGYTAPQMQDEAICITGMHRSGTSMVARLLNLTGVYLGPEERMLPPKPDNPAGFWENFDFVHFNDQLLISLGGGWDYPPTDFDKDWINQESIQFLKDKAAQYIQSFTKHQIWGWKDPRTSLTLPFWYQLLPDLKVVVCLRNPLEVAASLQKRNYTSIPFGLNLWLAYNKRLLQNSSPDNRIVTHYKAYIANPQKELKRVLDYLGIVVSEETIFQAVQTVSESLRHSEYSSQDIRKWPHMSEVADLYEVLCREANYDFNKKSTYATVRPPTSQGLAIANGDTMLPLNNNTNLTQAAIIIVTYNSADSIRQCLDSVLQHSPDAEVMVVDNASQDNTRTILNDYKDRINTIFNDDNLGFSAACNQGIRATETDYVVLLNPDTVVTPNWLGRLLRHFKPGVGAVGPTADYVAGLQKFQLYLPSDRPKEFDLDTLLTLLNQNQGQSVETKLLIGFCMVLSRKALDDVGLLDEALFLGNDDLDISWRLRRHGYKLLVATDTFVHHKGQVSFKTEKKTKTDKLVQESTDILYTKLAAHYGEDNVPAPEDLWGITWFTPTNARFRPPSSRSGQAVAPLTSIIILTHNQLEYTKLCLQSIEQHTPEPLELIIVDNASTDDTPTYLRQYAMAHDNVRVIFNEENKGFAAGNNQGLAIANGDYVLLLNNDTVVTDGWLGYMLNLFNRYPDVGLVGPVSNYASGYQWIKQTNYQNMSEMDRFAKQWHNQHRGQSAEVYKLIGFCLLARKEVIEKIGGLDEQFGLGNFEDDDFCIRANMAGFKGRVALDVFIHHAGNRTFQDLGLDYNHSLEKNWAIFKKRWKLPDDLNYDTDYRPHLDMTAAGQLVSPLPDEANVTPLVYDPAHDPELLAAQEKINETLAPGQAALEANDFDGAVREFAAAAEQYPDLAAAHVALGNTLLALGRLDEAVEPLRRAAELVPGEASLHNQLGQTLYRLDRQDEAEAAFNRARNANPGDVESLLNLIDLYKGQKRLKEAMTATRQALQQAPDNYDVLVAYALLMLDTGDIEAAEMAWGHLYNAPQNHPGVIALLTTLVRKGSRKVTMHTLLDWVETAQQEEDWPRAIKLLKSVLGGVQGPASEIADLWNSLGYCHFRAGNPVEATIAFESGLNIDPQNLNILSNLADIYARQEQFDKATGYINRALAIDPYDVNTLMLLGNIAITLGELDTALMAYQRVQEVAPETEGVNDVVNELLAMGVEVNVPAPATPSTVSNEHDFAADMAAFEAELLGHPPPDSPHHANRPD